MIQRIQEYTEYKESLNEGLLSKFIKIVRTGFSNLVDMIKSTAEKVPATITKSFFKNIKNLHDTNIKEGVGDIPTWDSASNKKRLDFYSQAFSEGICEQLTVNKSTARHVIGEITSLMDADHADKVKMIVSDINETIIYRLYLEKSGKTSLKPSRKTWGTILVIIFTNPKTGKKYRVDFTFFLGEKPDEFEFYIIPSYVVIQDLDINKYI